MEKKMEMKDTTFAVWKKKRFLTKIKTFYAKRSTQCFPLNS